MIEINIPLVVGAILSGIAALLHIAIILGGAEWYRFFGAGERMAEAAESGRLYPAVITLGITLVLATWALYALSGAGVLPPLPWLKFGLIVISAVYLLRGLAIVPFLTLARDQSTPFLIWSSLISLIYGGVHVLGLTQVWSRLPG